MPKLTKANAYKIVFNDLEKKPMFMGRYDAENGSDAFMYGIKTVMDVIALGVSEDMYEQFSDIFLANLIGSQAKPSTDCEHTDCPWK